MPIVIECWSKGLQSNHAALIKVVIYGMWKNKFSFVGSQKIIMSMCSSGHLPILHVSSAREPGTCGQTVPDCPLRCERWSHVLVWHSPLPGLQLLHTWTPPYPRLYLQGEKHKLWFKWSTDDRLMLIDVLFELIDVCAETFFHVHLLKKESIGFIFPTQWLRPFLSTVYVLHVTQEIWPLHLTQHTPGEVGSHATSPRVRN